jgi:hypothetical protein
LPVVKGGHFSLFSARLWLLLIGSNRRDYVFNQRQLLLNNAFVLTKQCAGAEVLLCLSPLWVDIERDGGFTNPTALLSDSSLI